MSCLNPYADNPKPSSVTAWIIRKNGISMGCSLQWWQPISKQQPLLTSNIWTSKQTTAHGVRYPGQCLEEAHKCDGVQPLIWNHAPLLYTLISNDNTYINKQTKTFINSLPRQKDHTPQKKIMTTTTWPVHKQCQFLSLIEENKFVYIIFQFDIFFWLKLVNGIAEIT